MREPESWALHMQLTINDYFAITGTLPLLHRSKVNRRKVTSHAERNTISFRCYCLPAQNFRDMRPFWPRFHAVL